MIRRIRDLREVTQDELAEYIGITPGAVSQWEKGRTHPSRARSMKMDNYLRANGEILASLGYATTPRVVEAVSPEQANPATEAVVLAQRQIANSLDALAGRLGALETLSATRFEEILALLRPGVASSRRTR